MGTSDNRDWEVQVLAELDRMEAIRFPRPYDHLSQSLAEMVQGMDRIRQLATSSLSSKRRQAPVSTPNKIALQENLHALERQLEARYEALQAAIRQQDAKIEASAKKMHHAQNDEKQQAHRALPPPLTSEPPSRLSQLKQDISFIDNDILSLQERLRHFGQS